MDFDKTRIQSIWPFQHRGHFLNDATLIETTMITPEVRLVRVAFDSNSHMMYFGDAQGLPLSYADTKKFIVEAPAYREICQPFGGFQLTPDHPFFVLFNLSAAVVYRVSLRDTDQILWSIHSEESDYRSSGIHPEQEMPDYYQAVFEHCRRSLAQGLTDLYAQTGAQVIPYFDPTPLREPTVPASAGYRLPVIDRPLTPRPSPYAHHRPEVFWALNDANYNWKSRTVRRQGGRAPRMPLILPPELQRS
ncbi:hypothetical protein BD626DRAFT_478712 [Schizophyllum amplum]|uniref:Uncharacterized protein n=1 Tax=Schizophyllum amplum TaxID=97359 RepID=A0A550CRH8_9AGAR|nr:hypothetical protein BD626DRAFT_478712 [Auriculariopsis ampla]